MKKIIALFVLLMLAACAAPQEPIAPAEPAAPAEMPVIAEPPVVEEKEEPVIDTTTAERLAEEQKEKIIEAIEHPPKLPARNRTTIVGEMWDKFNSLDSYHYKSFKGLFLIRGDKVRYLPLKQFHMNNVVQDGKKYNDVFIDEIIFDRAKRTATGYCSGFVSDIAKQCITQGLSDVAFNLPYDAYYLKTADDWSREYMYKPVIDEEYEKYYLGSIETVRVRFEDGVEMYFLPIVGLPIKIVKGPVEIIEFDKMLGNRVRPEDVIHRSRSEIPAQDIFFKEFY